MNAKELNNSQLFMLRQAIRDMDKSNFTRQGKQYHEELLTLLDSVDTWAGGKVVIHTGEA